MTFGTLVLGTIHFAALVGGKLICLALESIESFHGCSRDEQRMDEQR
jgi:hypothetical protein